MRALEMHIALYLLACAAIPQLWAVLVARIYARADRQRALGGARPKGPDYAI
jgi:hypothetical protein